MSGEFYRIKRHDMPKYYLTYPGWEATKSAACRYAANDDGRRIARDLVRNLQRNGVPAYLVKVTRKSKYRDVTAKELQGWGWSYNASEIITTQLLAWLKKP